MLLRLKPPSLRDLHFVAVADICASPPDAPLPSPPSLLPLASSRQQPLVSTPLLHSPHHHSAPLVSPPPPPPMLPSRTSPSPPLPSTLPTCIEPSEENINISGVQQLARQAVSAREAERGGEEREWRGGESATPSQQLPKFIVDSMMGKLLRWLRVIGVDTLSRAEGEPLSLPPPWSLLSPAWSTHSHKLFSPSPKRSGPNRNPPNLSTPASLLPRFLLCLPSSPRSSPSPHPSSPLPSSLLPAMPSRRGDLRAFSSRES